MSITPQERACPMRFPLLALSALFLAGAFGRIAVAQESADPIQKLVVPTPTGTAALCSRLHVD